MTEIRFYHLQRTGLEAALPQLLEKVIERGWRAVVMAGSAEHVAALNTQLWTYGNGSFLPHGSKMDGNASLQPIWLTHKDENPNEASVLFLLDGAGSDGVTQYDLCCDLFNGNDRDVVARARLRWKQFRAQGLTLTYWQQNEQGRWEEKAGDD